ncbi:MAG TPA: sigma-54 dependent transcriptional regulator, partial [Candidatus Binataceae bacterium]|nr:sigma-54 dependent transcriptional regulator [Candidatus Binataceae bacterium]
MSSIQEHAARARIVVIDSEPASSRQTVSALTAAGYECRSFGESDAAVATLNENGADVMLVDFSSEKSAAELLRKVRIQSPETAVVLTVPNPIVSSAVAAMRHGAFDYLTRPINTDELTAVIGKALEMASLRRENRLLHEQLDVASMAAAFIAESAASRNLAAMVRRAAPANSPVLIEGESGTGKELVARMLHHWSSRAQGPFVKVNFKSLAPMPSSSGMAGDTMRPHLGIAAMLSEYVDRAAGGTLFLDEISEATPDFQSALLRLTGEGGRPRTAGRSNAGVRIVASTNRPLAREVAGGRIRPDLYFALNVIAIQVAPLRERREDILPLARHFLALHAAESGRALMLTADAEKSLLAYSWPGNVRELENIIERAVVMSTSERISPEALMIPGATPSIAAPSASQVTVEAESPEEAAQAAEQITETALATE